MRNWNRATVSLLLAGAGVLWLLAAAERWWPQCRLGDFDDPACLARQDHLFDYVAPTAPWTPVGEAAALAAAALALLGVALVLLPLVLAGTTSPRAVLVSALLATPAMAVLWVAGVTWRAAGSGEPTGLPAAGAVLLLWCLGVPVALCVAAFRRVESLSPAGLLSRVALVVLLGVSNPLLEFVLAPLFLGYLSHDSTPWAEAVTSVALLGAAVVLWPATRAADASARELVAA